MSLLHPAINRFQSAFHLREACAWSGSMTTPSMGATNVRIAIIPAHPGNANAQKIF
jgi:hypothetical protein